MPSISFGCVDVPEDLRAAVDLMAFSDIPGYLARYGFEAADAKTWSDAGAARIDARIDHHTEQEGHTWYTIRCVISSNGGARREWTVARRLEHVRIHLYDRVRQDLSTEVYEERFAAAPFARRFGLPGTSARVDTWLTTLSNHASSGRMPPLVVAQLLRFLAAPGVDAPDAPRNSSAVGQLASNVFGRCVEDAAGPPPPVISKDMEFGEGLVGNRHEIDISTFDPKGLSTGSRRGGC